MFEKLYSKYKKQTKGTKSSLWLWILSFVTLIMFVAIVSSYTSVSKKYTGGAWVFNPTTQTEKLVKNGQGSQVPKAPIAVKNLEEWKKTSAGKKDAKYWVGLHFSGKIYTSEAKRSANLIATFSAIFIISLFAAIATTGISVYNIKRAKKEDVKNV